MKKTGLKSCQTGPNPAQISIPVPYKSPTARLLYNDFDYSVLALWKAARSAQLKEKIKIMVL
jgi:hypothetical protein